jgi:hypothetical protein
LASKSRCSETFNELVVAHLCMRGVRGATGPE